MRLGGSSGRNRELGGNGEEEDRSRRYNLRKMKRHESLCIPAAFEQVLTLINNQCEQLRTNSFEVQVEWPQTYGSDRIFL